MLNAVLQALHVPLFSNARLHPRHQRTSRLDHRPIALHILGNPLFDTMVSTRKQLSPSKRKSDDDGRSTVDAHYPARKPGRTQVGGMSMGEQ